MAIELPRYEFFLNGIAKGGKKGNPFCGSLGTDPVTGFINSTAFEYRVVLNKPEEGDNYFTAECWTCPPLSKAGKRIVENCESAQFEDGADSLPKIAGWLEEQAEKYL